MDKPPSKITPIPKVRSQYFYFGPVIMSIILAVSVFGLWAMLMDDWHAGSFGVLEVVFAGCGLFFTVRLTWEIIADILAAIKATRLRLVGVPAIAKLEWMDIDCVNVHGHWRKRTIKFRYFDDQGHRFFATQTRLPGRLAEVITNLPPGTAFVPVLYDPHTKKAVVDWRRWVRESTKGFPVA